MFQSESKPCRIWCAGRCGRKQILPSLFVDHRYSTFVCSEECSALVSPPRTGQRRQLKKNACGQFFGLAFEWPSYEDFQFDVWTQNFLGAAALYLVLENARNP